MFRGKLIFFILFFYQVCFYGSAGDILLTKKETLYSTLNGRSLGDVSFSVEVKSLVMNPKELYLIIGDKNDEIIESGKANRSLWFFNGSTTINDIRRDLRTRDYTLEVKNFREFMPFCENEIKFELKNWNEIKKQTKLTFFLDAPYGAEVTLKLHVYVATVDRRRTIIENDARVTLAFMLPEEPPSNTTVTSTSMSLGGGSGGSGGGASGSGSNNTGGGVTLEHSVVNPPPGTIEINEEEIAKKTMEAERLKQILELDAFISEKSKEINFLMIDLDQMTQDKSRKITMKMLDSMELAINEWRKKVEYYEKGYSEILLKDKSLLNKFTQFSSDQSVALNMLSDARHTIKSKYSWLTPVGIGLGVTLLGGMFFMQIFNQIRSKRQMLKMLNPNKGKERKEKKKKYNRNEELDKIDINDLDKI